MRHAIYSPVWTAEMSAAALAEGWDIFECFGSDCGPWQIQRDDSDGRFSSDDGAWVHVLTMAARGGLIHQRAIEFVRIHNPMEYRALMRFKEDLHDETP